MSRSPSHTSVDIDEEKAIESAPASSPSNDATTSNAPQMAPFPEGGAKAWGVVLGAMIINGCSFGYSTSFGVYQAYYQENQLSHKNPSDIAWIGSLQIFFMLGGGFLSGPLFDRYGARKIIVPATIGYTLGIMFTSLCTEYWQFILAQGIFGGICNGFIFSPAMAAVGHYFQKKKGAALGLVAVGSTVGGTIIPIVLQKAFYSKVGFAWGVRAVGFGIFFLLSIASLLVVERLPPRRGRIFAPEAFLQKSYTLAVSGIFFVFWGVFIIFFFISDYAIVKLNMSDSLAFYLLSIVNGSSLVGRMTFGFLGDKLGFLTLLVFVATINAVLLFTWTTTSSNAGLIVWSVFFGYASGGIFALFPAAIVSVTPKPQFIGTYMGQAMAVLAVAGLTGAPISGAIIDKYGFLDGSVFAGVALIAGAICLAGARYAKEPKWSVRV